MPVSPATYERVALEDQEGIWELHCGQLIRKPDMTMEHNWVARELAAELADQLPRARYQVGQEFPVLRTPGGLRYRPDVAVIPKGLARLLRGSTALETYDEPLPLVVEVWSPSTGDYDVDQKFAGYRERGDLEIWRIHPGDRVVLLLRRSGTGDGYEALGFTGTYRVAGGKVSAVEGNPFRGQLDGLSEDELWIRLAQAVGRSGP